MPETMRSPNLSHKPVPYTVICHKEEDEGEYCWSDDAEEVLKKLTNVNGEGFVAVEGNGLEKPLMTNPESETENDEKFRKENKVLPKNGLRQIHQRRTMESVKEMQQQQERKAKRENQNQLFDQFS